MCVRVRATVYVCKLADGEQPLFLRLLAGPDTDTLSFVLREQQTGEVMVRRRIHSASVPKQKKMFLLFVAEMFF